MPRGFELLVETDSRTGQLLSLRSADDQTMLLEFDPGAEIEWNGKPLECRCLYVETAPYEHVTVMRAELDVAYGARATLEIRRRIVLGGAPVRSGPPRSAHIRYEIRRIANEGKEDRTEYIWPPEIEAPLSLDFLTVLAAPQRWLGPTSRLRVYAMGGSGPREHVSVEDGPPSEVADYLRSAFRMSFPGQLTINGALCYVPTDERFVWAFARRPHQSGRLEIAARRLAWRFEWFQTLLPGDEITTPTVSLFWGHGLAESDAVVARQFDRYEEPPAWWWHTTWFWLHPIWQKGGTFETALQGMEILSDQCGVNGFGLLAHDIPWSGQDCDIAGYLPCPSAGGWDGLRRLVERIKARGGHAYVWMSRTGHRSETLSFRESWAIRGIDGKPIRLYPRKGNGVRLDIVNPADPTFEAYLKEWIEFYVRHVGIDGIFWDSGFQPLPPDFGNKRYLRNPGQTGPAILELYERLYRFGRSLSSDFFMWAEGISVDVPLNGFAVDSKTRIETFRHMQRIARRSPRRLVWRSRWSHDLASGFPFIYPQNDVGLMACPEVYERIAADPMNRWLCRLVKERGCRDAIGLEAGVSLLGEYVVVSPEAEGTFLLPKEYSMGVRLDSELDDGTCSGEPTAAGIKFSGVPAGAWRLSK